MKFEVSLQVLLLGLVCLLIAWPVLKILFWWLFSFEKRVQTILSQKKSSEVRLGKISETLAPFTDGFPVDLKKPGTSTVFIGQPVDYIHFDPETGVTFIEVKSGNAKLSLSQQKIKSLIESGQVSWADVRISGNKEIKTRPAKDRRIA